MQNIFLDSLTRELIQSSAVAYSFLMRRKKPIIRSATTICFLVISVMRNLRRSKNTVSTRVDSETDEKKPETLVMDYEEPAMLQSLIGFKDAARRRTEPL